MGGQRHPAVGHRDVEPLGAGQTADDGLPVGRQRAHTDLVAGDDRVLQAADRAARPVQAFGGPPAQVGVGGVQVHVRVGGLQVEQGAGVRAQR